MKISKFVITPLFIALAVSMSACDRSDWVSDETSTSHEADNKSGSIAYETSQDAPESDSEDTGIGGMGMTYGGKIGIDMGNGLVTPISGGMPQLGIGF